MVDATLTKEPTATAPTPEAPRLRGFALASVLGAAMLTLLLEALDQTVVSTALPIGSLQGFDRYIWVVTAYALASSLLIPVVGKLSDQFGRKGFLLAGTALFLIGSALCGLAQTMDALIIFRAVQGLGAGMGIAQVFTIVGDIFPPAERAKWQGLFGAVYGLSSVVGPSLGGWLTDHGPLVGSLVTDTTRWRWIFVVNLPLGVLALLALAIFLPKNISVRTSTLTGWAAIRRIDFLGAILSAAATVCLLLGLTWGSNSVFAWNSPQVLGVLAGAGVLYILFVVNERFAPEPIVPLNLFRNQIFTVTALLSLLQLMILVGLTIYLPLYLQGVLGVSASNSGLVITPMTLAAVVGSGVAGVVMARSKRYRFVAIIGAVVLTVGTLLMTQLTTTTPVGLLTIFMIIGGLGLGTFFGLLALAAQNALPRAQLGVGTAAVRYMGQVGGVLGVAIIGAVVNGALSNDLTPRLARIPNISAMPTSVVNAATNPQVLVNSDYRIGLVQGVLQHTPPQYPSAAATTLNQIFDALKHSLTVGIVDGIWVTAGLCILMVILTFVLREKPLETSDGEGGWA